MRHRKSLVARQEEQLLQGRGASAPGHTSSRPLLCRNVCVARRTWLVGALARRRCFVAMSGCDHPTPNNKAPNLAHRYHTDIMENNQAVAPVAKDDYPAAAPVVQPAPPAPAAPAVVAPAAPAPAAPAAVVDPAHVAAVVPQAERRTRCSCCQDAHTKAIIRGVVGLVFLALLVLPVGVVADSYRRHSGEDAVLECLCTQQAILFVISMCMAGITPDPEERSLEASDVRAWTTLLLGGFLLANVVTTVCAFLHVHDDSLVLWHVLGMFPLPMLLGAILATIVACGAVIGICALSCCIAEALGASMSASGRTTPTLDG